MIGQELQSHLQIISYIYMLGLASDAYIIMTDLHAEFFAVKSDVQRRFRAPICTFLNNERRQLKSREQWKLYKIHRNSNARY